jgi:signal peptidase I
MEQDFLIEDIKRSETSRKARELRQQRKRKPLWREYAETAVIALVAAILLRIFVVSAYRVSSSSMEDSLFEGDYIFVNKLAFEYGSPPKAGDIVVFEYPNNPTKDFIKRVVAMPGQTVDIIDKVVYVDDQIASIPAMSKNIDQKIIPGDLSFRDNFGPFQVEEDQLFVMGDNRDDSRDSRFWGTVPMKNLKGKAIFVYWSWMPDESSPGWGFPYVIDAVHWLGWGIVNFPSHVRWSRLGTPL